MSLPDFLVAHEPKSDVAELEALRKELDDAITQLTGGAAAQEAITKQSWAQTIEIKRLRSALRDGKMKPIVRMSRTMKLEIRAVLGIVAIVEARDDSHRERHRS